MYSVGEFIQALVGYSEVVKWYGCAVWKTCFTPYANSENMDYSALSGFSLFANYTESLSSPNIRIASTLWVTHVTK